MYIINLVDNSIQNSNMETTEDLTNNGYDLTQWSIASDSQVSTYLFQQVVNKAYETNQANYDSKRNGVEVINGVAINIDPISCINITGQILQIYVNKASGGSPLSVPWLDDSNLPHVYTEDEFISLGQTVSYVIQQIQFKLSNNKIAIQNATTMDDLNNIDMNYSNF